MNKKPFSKLKKNIESLFVPELKMQFCCYAYPIRGQWVTHNSIPRFCVKLEKEIIWDFPKDFKKDLSELCFYDWAAANNISDLVRDYIDTPVENLMTKKFKFEKTGYIVQYLGQRNQDFFEFYYNLIPLFIAADRRLGKEKLIEWFVKHNNNSVQKILEKRFTML